MTAEPLILLKMIFFKHLSSKYENGEKKPWEACRVTTFYDERHERVKFLTVD